MLAFTDIRERNGILIFPDDADPARFWVLPLAVLTSTGLDDFSGQLTLFGRGDPDRAANILGCFWSLTLVAEKLEPHRAGLMAALSTEAAPARLSPVPVDAVTITATLNDDPLITAEKSQSVWGSGQIAMSGQVPPADAPALREAWEDGLKDARVAISLTISGAEPALVATDDTSVLSFDFGASHLRLAHATQSVASSQSAAGTRTLTYTQEISPGRRAAKKKIILTGFET